MKIVALSDGHGNLPKLNISGDILLIAGDICPAHSHNASFQEPWLLDNFIPWLDKFDFKHKLFCFGNHDFCGENPYFIKHKLIPKLPTNIHLLNDSGVNIEGLNIYGSPWCSIFYDWAFMIEESSLDEKFAKIPDNTDILVTHTPPYGLNDVVILREHEGSIGCKPLRERVNALPNLRLSVSGHIHTGHGITKIGNTTFANVSLLNEQYKMVYKPTEFEL